MSMAADYEFFSRPEWAGLQKAYGLVVPRAAADAAGLHVCRGRLRRSRRDRGLHQRRADREIRSGGAGRQQAARSRPTTRSCCWRRSAPAMRCAARCSRCSARSTSPRCAKPICARRAMTRLRRPTRWRAGCGRRSGSGRKLSPEVAPIWQLASDGSARTRDDVGDCDRVRRRRRDRLPGRAGVLSGLWTEGAVPRRCQTLRAGAGVAGLGRRGSLRRNAAPTSSPKARRSAATSRSSSIPARRMVSTIPILRISAGSRQRNATSSRVRSDRASSPARDVRSLRKGARCESPHRARTIP